MDVFARRSLATPRSHFASAREALLLEGAWSDDGTARSFVERARLWTLDEAIDARHAWIDEFAADVAARLGPGVDLAQGGRVANPWEAFAYLQALQLRYRIVKLLRPVAFFSGEGRLRSGDDLQLWLERGRDECYAALFDEIARSRRARLHVHWTGDGDRDEWRPAAAATAAVWRRWAGWLETRLAMRRQGQTRAPRVYLAGNPALLAPVCDALLAANAAPCWLTERFAYGLWRQWRRQGVRQLACHGAATQQASLPVDLKSSARTNSHGVSLGPAIACWLAGAGAASAGRQFGWLGELWRVFERAPPRCVVLDEDATPWKRAIVAVARAFGVRTLVVQHGAPCVSFGFAPLAADAIAVWGGAAQRQLLAWGVPPDKIVLTGAPHVGARAFRAREAPSKMSTGGPAILLLATLPPRDERPDAVAFRLTTAAHRDMLRAVFAAALARQGAVVVKPHPRAATAAPFHEAAREFPGLNWRISSDALPSVVAAADCVVSFASTAGIEAARLGAPVIQLLPMGSADILPANDWGLAGAARDAAEFGRLLDLVLLGAWRATPGEPFAATGREAAENVAAWALDAFDSKATTEGVFRRPGLLA